MLVLKLVKNLLEASAEGCFLEACRGFLEFDIATANLCCPHVAASSSVLVCGAPFRHPAGFRTQTTKL